MEKMPALLIRQSILRPDSAHLLLKLLMEANEETSNSLTCMSDAFNPDPNLPGLLVHHRSQHIILLNAEAAVTR